jgi:nucleoid-associated protein YgaU
LGESSPSESRPGEADSREIVVGRGDTLWNLAERHLGPGATVSQIAAEWPRWFTANRAVIGNDPNHLVPGERLRPPEKKARPTERPRNTRARVQAQAGGVR